MSSESSSKPWSCPCGRIVHGNGGRSSHQRTCEVYHRSERDSWARNIETWENDPAGGHGMDIRNARRKLAEHDVALAAIKDRQVAVLKSELAPGRRVEPAAAENSPAPAVTES